MLKFEQSPIGGEFEYDLSLFCKRQEKRLEEGFFYSSGRAALYHIFLYIKNKLGKTVVYLPDYLCESIVESARLAGFNIRFYPVLSDLLPDIGYLKKCDHLGEAAVLLINYYGGIRLENIITDLKVFYDSACVIKDNVQAYFAMSAESGADFSFTSFRKQFSLPDGAWVKSKYSDLQVVSGENTFVRYKLAGGILKSLRGCRGITDETYLSFFRQGEELINQNLNAAMSDISAHILSKLNVLEVASVRIRNAAYLVKKLKEIDISPLIYFDQGQVPLFVPVYLQNRDDIRNSLFRENIFCPVHWPCTQTSLKKGVEMARHELSLVIDQRYDCADMDRIIRVLKRCYGN